MSKEKILQALSVLHPGGSVFELCAIGVKQPRAPIWEGHAGGKKAIVAGWFRDHQKAADLAVQLDQIKAEGVYITLNSCNPALLARANHRLVAGVNRTQDADITMLRHLMVDVDPKRPQGISASLTEHEAALQLTQRIKKDMEVQGWPEPIWADSGNGGHLLYRIDLPNTPENIDLIKRCLKALAEKYTTDDLSIDQSVFNPSRLCKLYGTTARKGDHTSERPHRIARIL